MQQLHEADCRDPETTATLSFLDEFEWLENDLCVELELTTALAPLPLPETALNDSSKSVNTQKKKRVRKKTSDYNPNKARDERRQEMRFLAIKAEELQTELEQLQTTGVSATTVAKSIPSYALCDDADDSSFKPNDWLKAAWTQSSVWKELAARQYAECHKAELENLRLKMVLEEQMRMAAKLQKLLRKKRPLLDAIHAPSIKKKPAEAAIDDEEDAILAELRARLAKAIYEVDAVFAANGLSSIEYPFQDAVVRNHGARGIVLEVFSNKVVPFDLHSTANAVYEHFTTSIKRVPYRSYYFKEPTPVDDVVFESFGYELQSKRTSGDFHVTQVLRRFVQEDRVLIAWKCRLVPVRFSDQSLSSSSICIHECDYIMVKRPTTMPDNYSLIQTCYVMNHTSSDLSPAQESIIGQISDFFLDLNLRDIVVNNQAIENQLMLESLQLNQPSSPSILTL